MNLMQTIDDFVKQSKRVIMITYKPKDAEYRQMALTTGAGMVLIGLIGFIISMAAYALRHV
ncbi:protein translocase SEC61 complex subunit gamma [Candidatus Micrarchaeota archaeon CG_4_10_14_0_2_um_filter_60_11]|nr:MAG: protein translocase SEC61 complex subunit gamma [Candidatus Micrarchaeota archaeon CG1_02_60_51]PIN95957.1 MAG: protein translocase SEC61 complex subunit gamma [Candidatus Micrarchaeota archaeon CG10_big_fil_rev_8_21_14_0_10_60_32]PIO02288.1 MAG: protein translocase SEC61 complex subunit gamma [Candidatus Micrarchaeota archaeon CG09_land_8_20_14_0_10_60_16]PIY91166.1 MAG: protein translocase SEC61 complex subunit gamma [Candidatus Micrarchaeota archaeon CG_4_10_14_0_8_um_filter_60_7]PIZ